MRVGQFADIQLVLALMVCERLKTDAFELLYKPFAKMIPA